MKISGIIAGVIGGIAVCGLDSNSVWPVITAFICLGYLVFVAIVNWDSWMRYWNSKGYWNYADEDLGEIEDLWGRADVLEWDDKWRKK